MTTTAIARTVRWFEPLSLGRRFFFVWFAQTVSLFTIAMTRFALAIWTYQNSGSIIQYSIVIVCISLPGLIASPLAGSIVDHYDRRRVIMAVDGVFVVVSLVMGLLAFLGSLELWHVYVVGAITSVCLTFRLPAFLATTALLVPKAQLTRANGMTHLATSLAQIAAPAASAALLVCIGLPGIAALGALGFAASVAILGLLRFPSLRATGNAPSQKRSNSARDLLEAINYLRGRPGLMFLLTYCAVQSLVLTTVLVLFTPMVLAQHSEVALGNIMSIAGLGTLGGSLAMIVYGAPKRVVVTILTVDILSGISVGATGVVTQVPALGVALFVTMFGCAVFQATTQAFWQRKIPIALHGRVFALESALTTGTMPLAAFVGGLLADRVFEPSFLPNGALAEVFGAVISPGTGAGIQFMFISAGIVIGALGVAAALYKQFRQVEVLPDAH